MIIYHRTCSIEITGVYSVGYAEVGTYPTPTLEYTINKKTLNTVTTGLSNMIPGAYPPIVSNSYETITGQLKWCCYITNTTS